VNNTPRQINMFMRSARRRRRSARATVLGEDGAKLSKRHGAVSVMEYEARATCPTPMVELPRAHRMAHGDDEVFSRGSSSNGSTSRASARAVALQPGKLNWVNQEHMKRMPRTISARSWRRTSSAPGSTARRPRPGRVAALLARPRRDARRDGRRGAYFYATPTPARTRSPSR
jgi:glutamyl-tRNA synthetase